MLVAQSLGEYGGASGIMAQLAARFQSAAQWVELSLREHPAGWTAAGICLLLALWFFRRR